MYYLHKIVKVKKEELIMENKKLEDHKIDKGKLENATGGYKLKGFPIIGGISSIVLNEEEQNILKKAGYIEHLKDSQKEYISKSKFEKAQKLLGKEGKINADDLNDDIVSLGFGCKSISIK